MIRRDHETRERKDFVLRIGVATLIIAFLELLCASAFSAESPVNEREFNVAFRGAEEGVMLTGTVEVPHGSGPFPAILLINGSGSADRDEPVGRHKLFKQLANNLSSLGFIVLRYDKRGVGASTGNKEYAATTAVLADDALVAFSYLSTRVDVIANKAGVLGHSEGGDIAAMIAAKDPKISFVVMMAGPGMPMRQIMLEQSALIGHAMGEPADKIEKDAKFQQDVYQGFLKLSADADKKQVVQFLKIVANTDNYYLSQADQQAYLQFLFGKWSYWTRYALKLDVREDLRKIAVPLLAVDGTKDLQVPSFETQCSIRENTKQDKDVTIIPLPGLYHLFQRAVKGTPNEYGMIDEGIDPAALSVIDTWLSAHVIIK